MAKLRLLALGLVVGALLAAGLTFGVTEASATSTNSAPWVASTTSPAEFVGISPVRILDTRVPTGAPTKGPLGPGQSIDVAIAGIDGIPTDATAAAVSVTSANATASSYFAVYPTGGTKPATSTANISPGLSLAASGIFDLGTGGKLTVFNASGSVNAIMDVTGYYVVVPAPPPSPVTYNWSGTIPSTSLPDTTLNASTVIPAGSTVTVTSASLSGDFSSCPSLAIVDLAVSSGASSPYLAEWPGTLSGVVSGVAPSTTTPVTLGPTQVLEWQVLCEAPATTPAITFNATFTVTPAPTPYS